MTYKQQPFKKWNGLDPLVLFGTDEYFNDCDQIYDYVIDRFEKDLEELEFMICEPNYAEEIEFDELFDDVLPQEESIQDLWPELYEAFEAVNKLIRTKKRPLSWREGEFRTSVLEELIKQGYFQNSQIETQKQS